ncbi:MAG: cation transporting ATPase C-terminal domain-containing protein, partial [Armatimonadota bacterium]
ERGSGLVNEITRNPWVWGAVALCFGLVAAALGFPGFAHVLHVAWPSTGGTVLALVASLTPVLAGQVYLALSPRGETEGRAE